MKEGFVKQRMAQESLDVGQTKIIAVRPTKDETKVQLVYLQNTGDLNIMALHNLGDDRWNSSSGRPAWITATLQFIEKFYADYPEILLGAQQAIEDQDYVSLDIDTPKVKGYELAVHFRETLIPRASDIANNERLQQNAKQDNNGNFLLKDGYAIFERVTLDLRRKVPMEVDPETGEKVKVYHQRIEHNSTTTDFQDLMYHEPRATGNDPDKEKAPKGDKDLTGQEA